MQYIVVVVGNPQYLQNLIELKDGVKHPTIQQYIPQPDHIPDLTDQISGSALAELEQLAVSNTNDKPSHVESIYLGDNSQAPEWVYHLTLSNLLREEPQVTARYWKIINWGCSSVPTDIRFTRRDQVVMYTEDGVPQDWFLRVFAAYHPIASEKMSVYGFPVDGSPGGSITYDAESGVQHEYRSEWEIWRKKVELGLVPYDQHMFLAYTHEHTAVGNHVLDRSEVLPDMITAARDVCVFESPDKVVSISKERAYILAGKAKGEQLMRESRRENSQ